MMREEDRDRDPKDTIAHQMMGDEMARGAEQAFVGLIELASIER
jgi:hypothetical protein